MQVSFEPVIYNLIKQAVYDGTREALADHFAQAQGKGFEPVAPDVKPQAAEAVAQDTQGQAKKSTAKKPAPTIAEADLPTTGAPLPEQKPVENPEAAKPANEPTVEAKPEDFDDVESEGAEPVARSYQADCVPLCRQITTLPSGVASLQGLLKKYNVTNFRLLPAEKIGELYNDLHELAENLATKQAA